MATTSTAAERTNTTQGVVLPDWQLEVLASAGLHLAQVRGTSFEDIARRDLNALSVMFFEQAQASA